MFVEAEQDVFVCDHLLVSPSFVCMKMREASVFLLIVSCVSSAFASVPSDLVFHAAALTGKLCIVYTASQGLFLFYSGFPT